MEKPAIDYALENIEIFSVLNIQRAVATIRLVLWWIQKINISSKRWKRSKLHNILDGMGGDEIYLIMVGITRIMEFILTLAAYSQVAFFRAPKIYSVKKQDKHLSVIQ